jgi:Peptidase propeptide and YPEB domain
MPGVTPLLREIIMRTWIVIPAMLFAMLALSRPAAAQNVIFVPGAGVTASVAQDIAVGNGVIAIRKIEFDDGAWKVEGRDREGRRVEMKIHPGTGEIIKLERYR